MLRGRKWECLAPIRTIVGERTKLNYPFGVTVEGDGDVYVANLFMQEAPKNRGSVTVYGRRANGNRAPIRKIKGRETGLGGPNEITIH